MFKKFFLIVICFVGGLALFAQDIIIMKNGDEIQSTVLEVGLNAIKYKKIDNPNGPTYMLENSEIFMIKYENGSKDVFSESVSDISAKIQKQTSENTKSLLYYNRRVVWQDGIKLTPELTRTVMLGNHEAIQQYNSGRSLYIVGQVISIPCAALLGWDLGSRIGSGGEEGDALLLGVGATGTLIGLLISFSGQNKIKTSLQLYNSKARNIGAYKMNFGFTESGIGLSMRF